MKKMLPLFIVLLLTTFAITSCEKDDKEVESKVTITVKDASGVKPNFTVYAMVSSSFNILGVEPIHADKQLVTDDSGKTTFLLSEFRNATFRGNNTQETIYFFCLYTIQGDDNTYQSVKGITVNKGEHLFEEILLN